MLVFLITCMFLFMLTACNKEESNQVEDNKNVTNLEESKKERDMEEDRPDSVIVDNQTENNEEDDNEVEDNNTYTFPIQIPTGEEIYIDLDGDGSKDRVSYQVKVNGYEPNQIVTFSINNIEYAYDLEDFEVYITEPHSDWYYITDLNTSDSFKEIAILDDGPSDDPTTHFFRYEKNEFKYVGEIPDFPHYSTCHFEGDGTVIARYPLDLLQTWWAPGIWKLTEQGQLEKIHEDMYYPYDYTTSDFIPTLLMDFYVYQEPDKNSEQIPLTAGTIVSFIATDNQHWVCLKTEDGIEGWFYMENYSEILYNGGSIESTTVFENLIFAG